MVRVVLALLVLLAGCGDQFRQERVTAGSCSALVTRPPHGHGPWPVVIALHGGGWATPGAHDMDGLARALAARGVATIAPDYRLSSQAKWPAQIQDTLDAVGMVASLSEAFGFNPRAIGTVGVSAGGQLATLGAFLDPRVRAFAVVDGVLDLHDMTQFDSTEPELVHDLLGHDPSPGDLDALSPCSHVRPMDGFIIHARFDQHVHVEQAFGLERDMILVGPAPTMLIRENSIHSGLDQDRIQDDVAAWMRDHLYRED